MQAIRTIICLAALALGGAAGAASGGKIGTLPRGAYVCEMPGDASTNRGIPTPDEDFTITNASTYSAANGSGSYLKTGEIVAMTSGPKKGARYELKNNRFLRKLGADGSPSGLRCIRQGVQSS